MTQEFIESRGLLFLLRNSTYTYRCRGVNHGNKRPSKTNLLSINCTNITLNISKNPSPPPLNAQFTSSIPRFFNPGFSALTRFSVFKTYRWLGAEESEAIWSSYSWFDESCISNSVLFGVFLLCATLGAGKRSCWTRGVCYGCSFLIEKLRRTTAPAFWVSRWIMKTDLPICIQLRQCRGIPFEAGSSKMP